VDPGEAVGPQELDSPPADFRIALNPRKLEYARALLSHAIPSGDLGQVIDRALDALIREQERRKFAVTPKPRTSERRSPSPHSRHIPARVKREVWRRDGGRCTFVGLDGHRCEERRFLEFDHVRPVALGGEATVEDLRLRCRAHNQYEAERMFGREFMARKREARRARERAAVRSLGPPRGTGHDPGVAGPATSDSPPVVDAEVAEEPEVVTLESRSGGLPEPG
jgi:5-methylcytosine-specific restriction endonuclease McrA